jgi:hypothetical protein
MLRKQLILLALVVTLLPATAWAADPRGVAPSEPNPLAGVTFYNQPDSPAMNEWRHLERMGEHGKADLIWKIASQPKALWIGRFTRPNVARAIRAAARPRTAGPRTGTTTSPA